MAKVIMHEAKDGSIHKTQKECEAVNLGLRLRPAAQAFANGIRAEQPGVSIDDRGYVGVVQADMDDFIVANADALRKILNEALVTKRPRKVKSVVVSAIVEAVGVTA